MKKAGSHHAQPHVDTIELVKRLFSGIVPNGAGHIEHQCCALRNDSTESDILSFTEAAADEIDGWE